MISRILSEDHKAVEVLLKSFLKSVEEGAPSTEEFEKARCRLHTRIYWEETFLFPSVENGANSLRLHGLEVEHGGIWKLLDRIEGYVEVGKPDLVIDRLEGLLRVLKTHSDAEEKAVYAELENQSEEEQARHILSGLEQAITPKGWVCKTIERYTK